MKNARGGGASGREAAHCNRTQIWKPKQPQMVHEKVQGAQTEHGEGRHEVTVREASEGQGDHATVQILNGSQSMCGTTSTCDQSKAQPTHRAEDAQIVGEDEVLVEVAEAAVEPFEPVRAKRANRNRAGGGLAPSGIEAPDDAKAVISGPRFFGNEEQAVPGSQTMETTQPRRRIPSK